MHLGEPSPAICALPPCSETCAANHASRVYEEYYAETFLSNESASNIAWIGSIQSFFQFSAGTISGPITDRYGPRVTSSLLCREAHYSIANFNVDYYMDLLHHLCCLSYAH
jgi:hypothetical protein